MTVQEWLGKDNQIGIDIWEKKYRQNNESFDEWLDRVSGGDKKVRKLIEERKFLFGGRILSNRGLHKQGVKSTYSNCYVIAPPEDNIESIYECASKLARTYSYGGGCGVDISKLSPKGAKVNNAAKETSGATSFMELYNLTTGLIGQNGRRGALMISMSCDHPDLEEFIDIKTDLNKINKANISIRITDKFMNAVCEDKMYDLEFIREETGEKITKRVKARKVFEKICRANWDYAEPGVLFWDQISYWNLLSEDDRFEYAGTNPCAEEPLPAGGSCLLGSINLAEFVKDDWTFNFDDFKNAVRIAVRALNDVLDEGLELHPLAEQRESVRNWRQIGLGIFGLADMLIKMGITYGKSQSIRVCNMIGFEMIDTAIRESIELAVENDQTYPMFDHDAVMNSQFFEHNTSERTKNAMRTYGLYNSQLLTIAPTGTISTMLGVSGGIEPIFANSYERKTESLHGEDKYYKIYTPIVQKYMDEHGLTDESELPDYFVTARDIPYDERIHMQSIWQRHVDASISSTINLPEEATVKDVMNLYMYAWEEGLKGVTIFRENCKRTGILITSQEKTTDLQEKTTEKGLARGEVIKASNDSIGKKRTLYTGCGTLHCEAFFDPKTGDLLETYLSKGSTGGCNNFMIGLSRMISLSARGGLSVDAIVDQLRSSGTCPSYAVRTATKHDTSKGSSCPVAVGNALIEMYEEMQEELGNKKIGDVFEEASKAAYQASTAMYKLTQALSNIPACPECGEELIFEGGCITCKSCGYSKCD